MNKKDFITMFVCNIIVALLLIEHLCGVDLALECMCIWGIVASIVNICILRNYVRVNAFVRKDCTR